MAEIFIIRNYRLSYNQLKNHHHKAMSKSHCTDTDEMTISSGEWNLLSHFIAEKQAESPSIRGNLVSHHKHIL